MIKSKSELAIYLSKLETFGISNSKNSILLEQYSTESEIAASVLWSAGMLGDIEKKVIADLGCGTGILGIGCLLLGAKKVYFVDTDKNVLATLQRNLRSVRRMGFRLGKFEIINCDVSEFSVEVDLVIQNPPFGTKQKHADKLFLEKAFNLSKLIYSFHKQETVSFIMAIAKDFGFTITHNWNFSFPLKQTKLFHKKKIQRINVGCWRMVKKEFNQP